MVKSTKPNARSNKTKKFWRYILFIIFGCLLVAGALLGGTAIAKKLAPDDPILDSETYTTSDSASDTSSTSLISNMATIAPTITKKPSARAVKDATLLFAYSNNLNRESLLKDWSQGTNTESVAIENLANYLDSNPDWLAKTELALQTRASQNQAVSAIQYQPPKLIQYSPTSTETPTYIPTIPLTYPVTYTRSTVGNSVLGSDGTVYTKTGNQVSLGPYTNPVSYTRSIIGNNVLGSDGTVYSQTGNYIPLNP